MVKQKSIAFSYISGTSFIHKMSAWIKILFVPAWSITLFALPPIAAAITIVPIAILSLVIGFKPKDIFSDARPVIYYALLLSFFGILSYLMACATGAASFSASDALKSLINEETAFMLIKLLCAIQCASIMFRTSTSLEIREGFETIEKRIRKILGLKDKGTLSNTLSLFLCFIPMVFSLWEQSKRAWTARGGKQNLSMYRVLFITLFSVGLKKAYNTARAVAIRC